jgi:predicted RNase H-like nuclease (RuvC/YqgF family)
MTFDEWFHKEYEPADLQIKQYAENKEGLHIPATVYLEDLKKAFEAGLHADVHTDNSKVIAELEEKLANADYQLEGRDLKIKELEAENTELTDEVKKLKILVSSLVYEINQIWDINEMNDDLRRCVEKIDREVQLSKMAEEDRMVISALGFAIVPPKPKLDVKEA